jgi:effector-binding domain-containing protein
MSSDTSRYNVSLQVAAPRTIAAVHARLPIEAVSRSFRNYLDHVYAAAREGKVHLDGQNIFLYQDAPDDSSLTDVAFGVGITAPFTAVGNVQATPLPTGEVATVTHWGNYARLGDAHRAIIEWCESHGHRLTRTRWEVYGHWTDDESQVRTDVFYLLAPRA